MNRPAGGSRLTVVLCLAGIALTFVPDEAVRPLRGLLRDALLPGQLALHAACRQGRTGIAALGKSIQGNGKASARDDDLQATRLENRKLALEVASLRHEVEKLSHQQGLTPGIASPAPLVTSRLMAARILGEETAALWRGRKLLSVGAGGGISESALVLDDTRPIVDVGEDADLSPGDPAYAGRIVIGKIAEVGRFSSTLRLVTDPGYSGRARLMHRTSQGLMPGVEGTIVGDGSDLCRLRHITDPVNVGDEVFTGGSDGALPLPMYYGKVVRAELEAGANEWSVWVRPAAIDERLETVLILKRVLNGDRILAN
jgi:cell shape-determining protein MreC